MSKHLIETLRKPRPNGVRTIERAAWAMAHRAFRLFDEADKIERADVSPLSTVAATGSAELLQNATGDYMQAIEPLSGAAKLFGLSESFALAQNSSISFPTDTYMLSTAPWAEESAPIRVLRGAFAAKVLGPSRTLGIIVPVSRELLKRSQGRQVFNGIMRALLAQSLDLAAFSSDAGDDEKMQGLLYNLTPIASSGDCADDVALLLKELGRLGSSGRNAICLNPQDAATVLVRLPTLGIPIIQTRALAQGTIFAIDTAALATAISAPEFDISENGTVHMEDASPQEIVSGAAAVSDPVIAFFQTATMGVRLLVDVAWAPRNSALVVMQNVSWS